MAVEDHPQYAEWRKALDRMIEASTRLKEAQDTGDSGSIAAAFEDQRRAVNDYIVVADSVDAD